MSETVVPGGLRTITIWQPTGFTIIPVAHVLAVPTEIAATYDGDVGHFGAGEPGPCIRFSYSLLAVGALGFGEAHAVATRIAAHLAAIDGDWPASEAHVRLFPVVDVKLMYLVTPARIADPKPFSGFDGLLDTLRNMNPVAGGKLHT